MRTNQLIDSPSPTAQALVRSLVDLFSNDYSLSPREANVLLLATAGLHRKKIADRLGCSVATIDTYWRRLFKKTGTTSQCQVFAVLIIRAVTRNDPTSLRSTLSVTRL